MCVELKEKEELDDLVARVITRKAHAKSNYIKLDRQGKSERLTSKRTVREEGKEYNSRKAAPNELHQGGRHLNADESAIRPQTQRLLDGNPESSPE